MADVINRTPAPNGVYVYRQSVNTPDFPPAAWLVNPDLSSVRTFPTRHWKVVGETVVRMSAAERADVDAPPAPTGGVLYLASPDGSVWQVTVDDAGALATTKQ